MKEKTIEKIPYLGLKKISRIKSVKYIGVTAVKNIGHQRHLFLEVYENKKESKKIPVVRITLTKKDFGTYWPDKHVWTRQQVSYYRPIWMETHTGGILTDENILQSPEDLERIKNFCGTKLFDASWWWEHISRYEADMEFIVTRNTEYDHQMCSSCSSSWPCDFYHKQGIRRGFVANWHYI